MSPAHRRSLSHETQRAVAAKGVNVGGSMMHGYSQSAVVQFGLFSGQVIASCYNVMVGRRYNPTAQVDPPGLIALAFSA